ncbi:Trp biosynthesis-associated membrane protein, partial [Nocardioides massiliensis]
PAVPDRRSFGPALLAGLGGGTLATLAATRTWVTATGEAGGVDVAAEVSGTSAAPLPWALALVALASWGAILALRGRARVVVAALGALAAVGGLVAAGLALGETDERAVDAVIDRGALAETAETSLTAWPWVTIVALVVTAAAGVVAVRRSPQWPAMGARYDAPADAAGAATTAELADDAGARELWDALDRGLDPTDPPDPTRDTPTEGHPRSPLD